MDLNQLYRISDYEWSLPRSGDMKTDALIVGSEALITDMDHRLIQQITAISQLPGILDKLILLPDAYPEGIFPHGLVAAFDPADGVVLPQAVGHDINCGMRTVTTNLIYQDIEKIGRFGTQKLSSFNAAGLAIFACHGAGFWQELGLPRPPRNHLFFDRSLHVRPLLAIRDEYHRICALLLNRQEARWYEIFMGEIEPLDSLRSEVPSRVREGGWKGYESKRIERHIDAHLHDHFKKAARKTFELFKKDQFDWLFLGCKDEYRADFEPLLHPYLKDRLKGWLKTHSSDTEDRILKQALEIEKTL